MMLGKKAEGYPGKGLFCRPRPLRIAVVDRALCLGCGDCRSTCLRRCIRLDRSGKARIGRNCSGCGACAGTCTEGAISILSND
ncbi:MAG: hypothetical protein JXA64_07865 [Candidatus Fermentibacteraceae bacterium]|nr:hypothetical protein [Candidatus Fermentibacteraceae bacterium]